MGEAEAVVFEAWGLEEEGYDFVGEEGWLECKVQWCMSWFWKQMAYCLLVLL